MIAGAFAVLWVRQDRPGNDACRFAEAAGGYLIDGSATDADWNIWRYRVRAWDDGTTRRARIGANSRVFVQRSRDGAWSLNGEPAPDVAGAQDIDLAFTPATMTLPLRRLQLAVGEQAQVLVARLDPDGARLRPVHQTYRRISADRFERVEAETDTVNRFKIDAHFTVLECDGLWKAQGSVRADAG